MFRLNKDATKVKMKDHEIFDLINLPIDVFHVIRLYLRNYEYRRLLNVNQGQYEKLKRYTVYYPLSIYYSHAYYKNEEFRDKVNSRLFSPSEQISLYFTGGSTVESRFQPNTLHDIDQVRIAGIYPSEYFSENDLSLMNNIHILSLHFAFNYNSQVPYFETFPKIENLRTLTLINATWAFDLSNMKDVSNVKLVSCKLIRDIRPLENCTNLHLASFDLLEDISCLGRQKSIKLIDCPMVSDVSNLSSVEELVIESCGRVIKFDDLVGVHNLTISLSLTALPPRLNNHCLTVNFTRRQVWESTFFDGIVDCTFNNFQAPKLKERLINCPLRRFRMKKCKDIKSLENQLNFNTLQRLEIEECRDFNDVRDLGNIPYLIISHCEFLVSLEGLGKSRQKHVIISSCPRIKSFHQLKDVRKVEIIACEGFQSFQNVQNCQEIIIKLCNNLTPIGLFSPALPSTCKYLQVNLCRSFTSANGLEEVGVLEFFDCVQLSHISTLGSNSRQKLFFSGCPNITSIEHLSDSYQIKIHNCTGIKDLSTRSKQRNLIIVPTNGTNTDVLPNKTRRSCMRYFLW